MKKELINNLLLQNIELLASSSEIQRSYLKKLGSYPCLDELALEFDDAYATLENQTDVIISESVRVKLRYIDTILNFLSNTVKKNVWDESALDIEPWIEIRSIATSIINELD